MEDINIQFSNLPNDNMDIPESASILEERTQICPLCNSIVKLYFINFNEKILMCENVECEYPFGHEDIKFYKDVGDCYSGDDLCSNRSISTSVLGSTISSAAWADIEHINKVYESEDSQFEIRSNEFKDKITKMQTEKDNEDQLQKNVENIKELTKALSDINEKKTQCINNEKWLKNLMKMSGVKLLRQGEIEKLKKTELNIGTAELKIDIDSSNVSSITIELPSQKGS